MTTNQQWQAVLFRFSFLYSAHTVSHCVESGESNDNNKNKIFFVLQFLHYSLHGFALCQCVSFELCTNNTRTIHDTLFNFRTSRLLNNLIMRYYTRYRRYTGVLILFHLIFYKSTFCLLFIMNLRSTTALVLHILENRCVVV